MYSMIVWFNLAELIILCMILSQENFTYNSWWRSCRHIGGAAGSPDAILPLPMAVMGGGWIPWLDRSLYDSLINGLTCLFY